MTKMYDVDSHCLTDVYNKIRNFHVAFNHPAPTTVTKLDPQRKLARATWMREEIDEFLQSDTIHMDMDAMVDLLYFVVGTTVEMGIDPSVIFDIVHNANMTKLFPDGKPHYNELNKVIKPEGWREPDSDIKDYIDHLIDNDNSQLTLLLEEDENHSSNDR
mgnify:CR=1 FL=1|nr:MAG TPA: hypothetical protein [Caudoviricetes sp.]